MSLLRKLSWAHWTAAALLLPLTIAGCSCGDDTEESGPTITAFTAVPLTVAVGQTSAISWAVENAESVTIVAAPGGTLVDSSKQATGMVTTAPLTATTVFTLTAKDSED